MSAVYARCIRRFLYTLSRVEISVYAVYLDTCGRGLRKFHLVVVQGRRRNLQKSVMHVQSCCFANLALLLFAVLVAVAAAVA